MNRIGLTLATLARVPPQKHFFGRRGGSLWLVGLLGKEGAAQEQGGQQSKA